MTEDIAQSVDQLKRTLFGAIDVNQAIILILAWLVTWVLQIPLRRLLRATEDNLPDASWSRTLIVVMRRIVFPLTFLILTSLSLEVSKRLGQPAGFLELTSRLISIWLFYRLLTALVDTNLTSNKARFWSRRILLPFALIIGVLSALGILDNILSWGVHIESIGWKLTIGSMLLAAGIIVGFYFLARWVSRLLATSFLPEAGLEPSLVNTLSKIIAYIIIGFGVLIAMGSIGINLSTLTVVLGGLSVGLAFGLQEVINNFVSGFILLIERSIVPGDVVDVNNNVGEVQKVGIRSTIIRTRDNVDLIIPNSKFLTEIVTNMTYAEDLVRIHVAVGVSYNASPREVEQTLLAVAQQHTSILPDPAPTVQFREFGDSSLNFELLVWTLKAIETPVLTSDLRFGIWDALAARNIEIPFPQRDIHIRSGVPWSTLVQPNKDTAD